MTQGPSSFDEDQSKYVHGPAITDAANAAASPPTQAEFNALVGKFNALLAAARSAGLIQLD